MILLWSLILCMTVAENMNGGGYKIANSASYVAEYTSQQKFFDVYSKPIKTLYSEVHWRSHGKIPLPDDIIENFADKVMAVVGYEVDQVQADGTSVPITWAYNHHYCAWLMNSHTARLVHKPVDQRAHRMGLTHGNAQYYMDVESYDEDDDTTEYPSVQFFSEGNGGEMRKSWHGYPSHFAQLIQSPDTFLIAPMQIDTWNRNMTSAKFVPGGPLPKSSQIPGSAGYSGLLECPCSDRLEKVWNMTYSLRSEHCEEDSIDTADECFEAATAVVPSELYEFLKGNTSSGGCQVEMASNGTVNVYWNACGTPETTMSNGRVVGTALGIVNVTARLDRDAVELTIAGPSDRWFGVGFGSSTMCLHAQGDECPTGGPYAIVVANTTIFERKLDSHGAGTMLTSSVTVLSDTIDDGIRTVRVTRPLQGQTDGHYTFEYQASSLELIVATGCDEVFQHHCDHASSKINFVPVEVPMAVCRAGVQGSIGGTPFNNQKCAPPPTGDLLIQHNPTCHVQTYRGGLACCRDGLSLLDKDQKNPWPDQYLEYRLKFRFYYETFQAASSPRAAPSHQNAVRLIWATEAYSGEYDIPKCESGTPSSQCVHTITSRWKVRDFLHDCGLHDASGCTGKGSKDENRTAGIKLVYAGPHCHAPSCLSMELYNADTGRLLCRSEPVYGSSDAIFDERGFIAIPPCLYGADGLPEGELLSLNTTLLSIKRNNSTLAHTGEMALWQMRAVVIPREDALNRRAIDHGDTARRPRLR